MPTAADRKLTRADYVLLPEEQGIANLLGGELQMTPAPTAKHQSIVKRLGQRVGTPAEERGLGRFWFAPFDVFLSDADVVQPDFLFVAAGELHRVGERGLEGPPTLAVEVLSDSTRRQDEIEKRALYERSGVTEYWTVDPVLERVRLYLRPAPNAPFAGALELTAQRGDRLASPLFPGLDLPVSDLFA